MLSTADMYEIWWSRGEGPKMGPRFRRLEDALRYVRDKRGRASYAIHAPDGTWYTCNRRLL